MTRQVNKKTSQLQGNFTAGFGGQKPQRSQDVSFKTPYPQTPVKKFNGKYMPVHNQPKV